VERLGEFKKGKMPSSLLDRLDFLYEIPPPLEADVVVAAAAAAAAVVEESVEPVVAADAGAENAATTSIIHPAPKMPTDLSCLGVRMVT
jgi:hypothetical protein